MCSRDPRLKSCTFWRVDVSDFFSGCLFVFCFTGDVALIFCAAAGGGFSILSIIPLFIGLLFLCRLYSGRPHFVVGLFIPSTLEVTGAAFILRQFDGRGFGACVSFLRGGGLIDTVGLRSATGRASCRLFRAFAFLFSVSEGVEGGVSGDFGSPFFSK